jgi:hypothetical protein
VSGVGKGGELKDMGRCICIIQKKLFKHFYPPEINI